MDDATQKKLDRIKQLVGMSASSSVEEARSMALLACKMIREGGFEVVTKEEFVVVVAERVAMKKGAKVPATPSATKQAATGPGIRVQDIYPSPFNPRARRPAAPQSTIFSPEELEKIMNDVFGGHFGATADKGTWMEAQLGLTTHCRRCGIRLPAGVVAWVKVRGRKVVDERCVGCGHG